MSAKEIYARRSIRKFKQASPAPELIREVLDAARVAPSGNNKQPWRFIVYAGEEKKRLLAAMAAGTQRERKGDAKLKDFFEDPRYGSYVILNTVRVLQSAPIVIAVVNPYGKSPFEPVTSTERVAEIIDSLSIGAAVENMLLRAQELGIGTLWVGESFWAYPELTTQMGESGQLVCAIALGYADEAPAPRPRKALEEITEYRID